MLDCAVGTVKSRCSRGRARLAELLGVLRRRDGDPDHADAGEPRRRPPPVRSTRPRGAPRPGVTRRHRPDDPPARRTRRCTPMTDEPETADACAGRAGAPPARRGPARRADAAPTSPPGSTGSSPTSPTSPAAARRRRRPRRTPPAPGRPRCWSPPPPSSSSASAIGQVDRLRRRRRRRRRPLQRRRRRRRRRGRRARRRSEPAARRSEAARPTTGPMACSTRARPPSRSGCFTVATRRARPRRRPAPDSSANDGAGRLRGPGPRRPPPRHRLPRGGLGRRAPACPSGTASDPAVLVLRAPLGDTQVADLYLCGDPPTRSAR